MKKLIEGLRHFQSNLLWERQELFQRSVQGQKPQALLVTCSDSRVLPETLLQLDPGDLFIARNVGNLVPPPDAPGGEAAAIEYAVKQLGVSDVVVCGHYRCGAVAAMLEPNAAEQTNSVARWLIHAAETRETMERDYAQLTGVARWDKAVELNAVVQMRHLADHPPIAEALAAGKLRLHAWVLRFETSEIVAYDPATDDFSPLLASQCLPAPPPEPAKAAADAASSPTAAATTETGRSTLLADLSASLVVFAVALPLCVAIAKASGVPTAAALITAVVGGVVGGLLSGKPLQVSGPTASLVAVLAVFTEQQGLLALGVVVMLAGLLQIASSFLTLGRWVRAVSPAIILGVLAGIGASLFVQQCHIAVDDQASRSAFVNLGAIPQAFGNILNGHDGHTGHVPAALLGVLTMAVLLLWKPLVPASLKSVPAVPIAVAAATIAAAALSLPVQFVEFDGLQAAVRPIDPLSILALVSNATIWEYAATIAFVASAESLLTAAAVNQIGASKADFDRELRVQGLGNIVCGALGAPPMASVLVRTTANVQAGARTRWSAVLHGVWLLIFAAAAPWLLRMTPTAAFAAVLAVTGVKMIQFAAIWKLANDSRGEVVICIVVAAVVFGWGLAIGIGVGVGMAVVKLIYTFSRLRVRRIDDKRRDRTTLVLEGVATFIRLPKLAAALEKLPPRATINLDHRRLSYIDHACLTLLESWRREYEAAGGTVLLDWDAIRSRFQRARPRPSVVLPETASR